MSPVEILNRRLGESLGMVCGGDKPRFCWLYAPLMNWLVYDTDDRTLLRKTWADAPAPDGNPLGRVWLLAEWRVNQAFDHFGFGEGMRVAKTHEAGYAPYLETTLAPGQMPTDALTANYIWAIRKQLDQSAATLGDEDSMQNYMGEEAYTAARNAERDREINRERAAAEYDKYTGAYGNLQPGQVDGWMSWGGLGDSPVVKKLQESVAAG